MRLILVFCMLPMAAQSARKAGAAKVSITPARPIWLAGYESRTKPSEGVLQDIDAKALALQDDSGAIAVLVTLDLVGRDPSRCAYTACRRQLSPTCSPTGCWPQFGMRMSRSSRLAANGSSIVRAKPRSNPRARSLVSLELIKPFLPPPGRSSEGQARPHEASPSLHRSSTQPSANAEARTRFPHGV